MPAVRKIKDRSFNMTSDLTNQPDSGLMRKMRDRMLTSHFTELGIEPSSEYPFVYGVIMDLPIDINTATIVSLSDGNASLYTTSTFGVIGGFAHENVRNAACSFVKAANNYYDKAAPTTDFAYPLPGRIRFYLLAYDGVRVIEDDMEEVSTTGHVYHDLFMHGQAMLTELRLTAEGETDNDSATAEKRKEWDGEPGYVNCLLTAMSEGAITSAKIVASAPVPNLLELLPPDHNIREWINAQAFQYESLNAKKIIRVLKKSAQCTGLPFVAKHAELPTFHALNDGGLCARVFDIDIGAFNRTASIRLAPDNDPRVIALQREADAKKNS
jgi:hypothetical protein